MSAVKEFGKDKKDLTDRILNKINADITDVKLKKILKLIVKSDEN